MPDLPQFIRLSGETYVSIDIETDGLGPGVHSMLQLGAVAFRPDGETMDEFTANLKPLPELSQLPSTMEFWQKFPEQYKAVTANPGEPGIVMDSFDRWARHLPAHRWGPVAVAYPADFDLAFVNHYLWRFCGGSPFCHGAIDIKTVAMLVRREPYRDARKSTWPERWLSPEQSGTAHLALDDARDQGRQFFAMLRELDEAE